MEQENQNYKTYKFFPCVLDPFWIQNDECLRVYKRPLEQIIENIKCQDKTTKPNVVTDKSLSDVFQTN